MIKINVVTVGKVKEKYFTEALNEYVKRLSRFCDFTVTEVSEENYQKTDQALISVIKEKEAQRIIPHLKGFIIVTAIEGVKLSSVDFAKKLKAVTDGGNGVITFVVGGSYGLSEKIKQKADAVISFSDMTFPHTFFRVMLCEQIYRAFCINAGTSYHK